MPYIFCAHKFPANYETRLTKKIPCTAPYIIILNKSLLSSSFEWFYCFWHDIAQQDTLQKTLSGVIYPILARIAPPMAWTASKNPILSCSFLPKLIPPRTTKNINTDDKPSTLSEMYCMFFSGGSLSRIFSPHIGVGSSSPSAPWSIASSNFSFLFSVTSMDFVSDIRPLFLISSSLFLYLSHYHMDYCMNAVIDSFQGYVFEKVLPLVCELLPTEIWINHKPTLCILKFLKE